MPVCLPISTATGASSAGMAESQVISMVTTGRSSAMAKLTQLSSSAIAKTRDRVFFMEHTSIMKLSSLLRKADGSERNELHAHISRMPVNEHTLIYHISAVIATKIKKLL